MDFPHIQLQAGLALTMFSPDVMPALYGQPKTSQPGTSVKTAPSVASRRRDVRESIGEDGSEQHQPGRKSSMKKLGHFFRRKPYGGVHSSGQLATIRDEAETCQNEVAADACNNQGG